VATLEVERESLADKAQEMQQVSKVNEALRALAASLELDRELFGLLATHAATALYCTTLHERLAVAGARR